MATPQQRAAKKPAAGGLPALAKSRKEALLETVTQTTEADATADTTTKPKEEGSKKQKALRNTLLQKMQDAAYNGADAQKPETKKVSNEKAQPTTQAPAAAAAEATGGRKARLLAHIAQAFGVDAEELDGKEEEEDGGGDGDHRREGLSPTAFTALHKLYADGEGGPGFVEEDLQVQALVDEQAARRRGQTTREEKTAKNGSSTTAAAKKKTTTTTAPVDDARVREHTRRLQLLAATKQARTKNEHKQRRLQDRRPKPGIGGGDSSDSDDAVGRSGIGRKKRRTD